MTLLRAFILFCLLLLSFGVHQKAEAQIDDITDILGDILGGGDIGQQTPIFGPNPIDNIPVQLRFDIPPDYPQHGENIFDGHYIRLTAHSPIDPQSGIAGSQLLGESRILLTGLTSPLQISIAVPQSVTESMPYARINADITDINGNIILSTTNDVHYSYKDPVELILTPHNQSQPQSRSETLPKFSGLEIIKGAVKLGQNPPPFRGSVMTLQLIETGLVGGRSVTIAAETVQNLDRLTPPYTFEITRGLPQGGDPDPLAFNVWITDWAGRKTHVLPRPVPYNGPDITYSLTLDPIRLGSETKRGQQLEARAQAYNKIAGNIRFNAFKGLPSGAAMHIILLKANDRTGARQEIARSYKPISASQNNVPFELSAPSIYFDPYIPPPLLRITLISSDGRILFDSGEVPASDAFNAVTLAPVSGY